ncbi:hypothetical protein GCM10010121_059050 [Streptomyces brasiliensis]|uniref:Uncharacterized protein n=1 Tax=Streptomyces brasiliensis TaxID=1954 RepID=A0A917L4C5_9ACTN|nr:hypothetical protein GCM10010121_059050 [Streptomyces brasiliensis]
MRYARQLGGRARAGWAGGASSDSTAAGFPRGPLETHPNLWPGMSLFRPGPGTAVVGSATQVVERLAETLLPALGVRT